MKAIIRLVVVALMLSGWIVAALCVTVVRTPNPADPTQSKFIVIPKQRLGGVTQTYVDARGWTLADVSSHADLIARLIDAGKADQLQFLANPKVKQDVLSQLTDIISGKLPVSQTQPTTSKSAMRMGRL